MDRPRRSETSNPRPNARGNPWVGGSDSRVRASMLPAHPTVVQRDGRWEVESTVGTLHSGEYRIVDEFDLLRVDPGHLRLLRYLVKGFLLPSRRMGSFTTRQRYWPLTLTRAGCRQTDVPTEPHLVMARRDGLFQLGAVLRGVRPGHGWRPVHGPSIPEADRELSHRRPHTGPGRPLPCLRSVATRRTRPLVAWIPVPEPMGP